METQWYHLSKRPGLLVAVQVTATIAADLFSRLEPLVLAEVSDLELLAKGQQRDLVLQGALPWETYTFFLRQPRQANQPRQAGRRGRQARVRRRVVA